MIVNHKKVIELAEESGLVYNNGKCPDPTGVYPWHRKRLYEFAELCIKNQDILTTSTPKAA